jgi:adenylate kinase family enzyme
MGSAGLTARRHGHARPDAAPALPRRVHIIGGAGAGKSTLAGWLSARLNLPLYHLDALNFINASERRRPYNERVAAVAGIAAAPAWVTEGIFLGWTDALLVAADRVIWLDLPWYVALSRIVRRYVGASRRGANQYRGLRRLWRFLRWSAAYYRPMSRAQIDALPEESLHSRAATARHLRPYAHKLTRCRTTADVAAIRAAIEQAALVAD